MFQVDQGQFRKQTHVYVKNICNSLTFKILAKLLDQKQSFSAIKFDVTKKMQKT